jgi:transcriptional regulator with XRE-family HTH domain
MEKSIFDYISYKAFLRAQSRLRGRKSALAEAMGIQPTYLSHVLHGKAHLSLEQVELLNRFLHHTEDESHFLVLLVQKEKSGTKTLEAYFQKQIDDLFLKRLDLTKRLGTQNSLTEEDRSIYYSSWIYGALHMAVTVPELRTREVLLKHFNLTSERFQKVAEFLLRTGLIIEKGRELHPGPTFMRIGKDAHQIIKHHTNWRNQAIESLERESLQDLHYSAVVTLSEKDALKIKDLLLQGINDNIEIIKKSPEEKIFVYTMDFFELKKSSQN